MFKISPIQDKELQRQCAEACDAEFCPDLFAYSMTNQENGELMGFSQFDVLGEVGRIHTLKPRHGYSDFEAMFILGRATMNFIDLCGAHKCHAESGAADGRLLRSIGFKETDSGDFFADMTGFFDGHCDGKPVDLSK